MTDSSSAEGSGPVVLVVEDETELADLYAAWLGDEYTVRVAYSGAEALESFDESVAVVLLDRRLGDTTGDEVLRDIRERGTDCRVGMVSAVEPDFDILEMGFDDYLVKPVSGDDVRGLVSALVLRSAYDEGVRELFSLASKKAILEAEKTESELAASAEYQRLDDELAARRADLDETVRELDERDDFVGLYRDLARSLEPVDDAPDDERGEDT
jgi:DNA-binding response OmpR family regulator